jgi:tetratricopeptide (TPR) repeat protein
MSGETGCFALSQARFSALPDNSDVSAPSTMSQDDVLAGRRVRLVGKLASMSHRDAERLIRERGGRLIEKAAEPVDLVVVSDEAIDLQQLARDENLFNDTARTALAQGEVELLRESEFWTRLGLVDSGQGVERLYTPAMLAQLVRVPISTLRQWHRRGVLHAKREVRRLPYFDFEEVGVARKLAELLAAGCSLSTVHRKLAELARLLPESPRPLADPAVVVQGSCLYVRHGESLAEPSGQLLIDFDAPPADFTEAAAESPPVAILFQRADGLRGASSSRPRGSHPQAAEDLRSLAGEMDECGQSQQAIEVYRAILFSGESTAEDHFALAELLYRAGDLAAARERYYTAIERDEDFVEARSNLGCVLAEQGELELAEAAFRGALAYHPTYADAHYHLARLLDRMGQSAEASNHWQLFMDLAPASPWADEAQDRIAGDPAVGQVF